MRERVQTAALYALLALPIGACATPAPLPERATPRSVRLALLESGDWTPINQTAFVLYDTGEVIVQRSRWKPVSEFFTVTLTPKEVEGLLIKTQATELLTLDDAYDLAPTTSDLRPMLIEVADPKTSALKRVAVRGWLPESGTRLPMAEEPPPAAFLNAFQTMATYSHPRESPWIPQFLDIVVYPQPGTGGCPWPADWADLDSPGAQRKQDGSSIGRIRESGSHLAEVQRFLEKCQFNVDLRGRHVQLQLYVNLPHQVERP